MAIMDKGPVFNSVSCVRSCLAAARTENRWVESDKSSKVGGIVGVGWCHALQINSGTESQDDAPANGRKPTIEARRITIRHRNTSLVGLEQEWTLWLTERVIEGSLVTKHNSFLSRAGEGVIVSICGRYRAKPVELPTVGNGAAFRRCG
jgi:hypothetical protein